MLVLMTPNLFSLVSLYFLEIHNDFFLFSILWHKRSTSCEINFQNNKYHNHCTEFNTYFRSIYPELLLGKGVLKICSKYTGEHLCRSVISIKLQSNFIAITLRHGCSPINLLHIFRTPFLKNTSAWLLLLFELRTFIRNAYVSRRIF